MTVQTKQQTGTQPNFAQATGGAVAVIAKPRIPYHPVVQERFGVDQAAWRALIDAVWPTAKTTEGVILALSYCRARNLDPFKRPVHIVPVWNSAAGREVETVWPGINEVRTTAARTRGYAGCDPCVFGPDMTQTFTGQIGRGQDRRQVECEVTFPEWAQMTVYRIVGGQRVPFPGPRVYWLETYATIGKSDIPNDMWQTRPRGQLEKCFSPDTEVLTDAGFQRFDAVTGRIMQVTERGIEPTDAKPFRQEWAGEMIGVNGNALNFRVTPNHDMLTTAGKIEAAEMFAQATSVEKFRIPISVSGSRPEASVSDTAIQLAAAFVCDGARRPYGAFSIAVSRPYKIAALEQIGQYSSRQVRRSAGAEAHTDVRVITTRSDKTVLTYDEAVLEGLVDLDKTFDRELLLSLSQRQARLLVDTMIAFDGADNGRGTMRFYSSRRSTLAAFEIAAVAAGYAVSRRRERISDIGGPNYSITISDKRSLPVLRYSASQRARGDLGGIEKVAVNPDGEVWCCTVPSGVIVVRRNGLSMLCGNCAEAAALRRAFPEELGGELIADEVGHRMRDITPQAQPPRRPPSRLEAFEQAAEDRHDPEPDSPDEEEAPATASEPDDEGARSPAPAPDLAGGAEADAPAPAEVEGFSLIDVTGEVLDTIEIPEVYARQLANFIEGSSLWEDAKALAKINAEAVRRLSPELRDLVREAVQRRREMGDAA